MERLRLKRRPHRVLVLMLGCGLLLAGPLTAAAMEGDALSPLQQSWNLPPTYSAAAIESEVRDENTAQPLAGVIVVANWELQTWTEAAPLGHVMVMETVTDARGRFTFPAWGPKPRQPPEGYILYKGPQLLLFKSGYRPLTLHNREESEENLNTNPVHYSNWSGRIIRLKPFRKREDGYARHIGALTDLVEFAFFRPDCSWQHLPRLLVALDHELQQIRKNWIAVALESLDERERRNQAAVVKCGSLRQFLQRHHP